MASRVPHSLAWLRCIAQVMARSTRHRRSVLSIGSVGSVLSIGSVGSVLSIGGIGSLLSFASAGSILSIASAGSILSLLSSGAQRSILRVGGTSRRMPRLETRDRCRPFARSRVRR